MRRIHTFGGAYKSKQLCSALGRIRDRGQVKAPIPRCTLKQADEIGTKLRQLGGVKKGEKRLFSFNAI